MKRVLAATGLAMLIMLASQTYRYPAWKALRRPANELQLPNPHISPPAACQKVSIFCDLERPTPGSRYGDVVIHEMPEACFPEGNLFVAVQVSPQQYVEFLRCPTIGYEIDRNGNVRRIRTLISSGSRDIDSIAMNAVKTRRFTMPRHCVSCRMQTQVDVEF